MDQSAQKQSLQCEQPEDLHHPVGRVWGKDIEAAQRKDQDRQPRAKQMQRQVGPGPQRQAESQHCAAAGEYLA